MFCSQISVSYDMLHCHQCQRGRFLDKIIQLCVVFDVTQMSYQPSINVYQALKVKEGKINFYQALKLKEGRISFYWAPKVKEGRISVYWAPKVKEGRINVHWTFPVLPCTDSCYQVGKVVKGNLVLTELTRQSKNDFRICSVNWIQLVNTRSYFQNSINRARLAS